MAEVASDSVLPKVTEKLHNILILFKKGRQEGNLLPLKTRSLFIIPYDIAEKIVGCLSHHIL
jgi:hypothetical protein